MTRPKVHIATDHAGLDLSAQLIRRLTEAGYEVTHHGPTAYDPDDDYPSFCINAASAVVSDQEAGMLSLGIVIGGSGNGEQIAANKVAGARAALAWNEETARLARSHNNANIVAVGSRQHTPEEALGLIDTFLQEPFRGESRHTRRLAQISAFERRKSQA